MKNDLILATSTADIQTSFSFKNADLNKFSESIAKIAIDSVSRNIELAKIFGRILDTECYKEDGFSSVADFAEKTFGIKRASAYQLANVGRRFFNSDFCNAFAEFVQISVFEAERSLNISGGSGKNEFIFHGIISFS